MDTGDHHWNSDRAAADVGDARIIIHGEPDEHVLFGRWPAGFDLLELVRSSYGRSGAAVYTIAAKDVSCRNFWLGNFCAGLFLRWLLLHEFSEPAERNDVPHVAARRGCLWRAGGVRMGDNYDRGATSS